MDKSSDISLCPSPCPKQTRTRARDFLRLRTRIRTRTKLAIRTCLRTHVFDQLCRSLGSALQVLREGPLFVQIVCEGAILYVCDRSDFPYTAISNASQLKLGLHAYVSICNKLFHKLFVLKGDPSMEILTPR